MSKYSQQVVAEMPWIEKLTKGIRCDRLVRAPVGIYYPKYARSNQRSTNPEDYRCKNSAKWKFTVPKDIAKDKWSHSESGTYCWSHLWPELLNMEMEGRVKAFFKEYELSREKV